MMLLQIKELAEKTGLSTDSIRFYEKKNLIQPTLRADNNYRYYDERTLEKVMFIKHCRELDISIQEIQSLHALLEHPEQNCHQVNDIIDQHLIEVKAKIKTLQSFEKQLKTLRQSCQNESSIANCQIIKTLQTVD